MSQNRLLQTFILVFTLLSVSCDIGPVTQHAAPAGSSVTILKTTPEQTQVLRVGDVVNLKVEVKYELNVDSGTLSLVVQESDKSNVLMETDVLSKGAGVKVFDVEFVVPQTNAVQLFTALSAQGQTTTTTVDTRAFKVDPNGTQEIDFDAAAVIDRRDCSVAGITAGSSYEDAVSAFGEPEKSEITNETAGDNGPSGYLEYDGLIVALDEGVVVLVNSDRPDFPLRAGVGPPATRTQVIRTFGETVGMIEEDRELLIYRCGDIALPIGDIFVGVSLTQDVVGSVSVLADFER